MKAVRRCNDPAFPAAACAARAAAFALLLGAPFADQAQTDTAPPTVAITSPLSGDTVAFTITVTAGASGNVAGVQFKYNGIDLGAEDTTAPYSVTLDTTAVANGSYTLTAVARDAAGNLTTSEPVTVAVTNPCTFQNSPTDCGFFVQEKAPGRASIVSIGRDGETAVRLHTEPGDNNVTGSLDAERNDLSLGAVSATDCSDGREHWWAHSILFPDDYVAPPANGPGAWNWAVVFDFHNTGSTGQANFQIDMLAPEVESGDLTFAVSAAGIQNYRMRIGPIVRNAWYDFVYHVKWSSAADGLFDAWVNGVKKMAYRGPTLYENQGCYLKLANYHTSTGQASSVIHDRVVRGTTPEAVSLTSLPQTRVTRFEETAPSVAYAGVWAQDGSRPWSGGTARFSGTAHAQATFTFTGTSVSWIGGRGPQTGIARVSLDGTLLAEVDTFATTEQMQAIVFSATGLTAGRHSLNIEVTGLKNAASADALIVVDAFDVGHEASGPQGGVLQIPTAASKVTGIPKSHRRSSLSPFQPLQPRREPAGQKADHDPLPFLPSERARVAGEKGVSALGRRVRTDLMDGIAENENILELGHVPQRGRRQVGRFCDDPVQRLEKVRHFLRQVALGGALAGVAMVDGGEARIEEHRAGPDDPQPSVDILSRLDAFREPADPSQDFLFHHHRRGENRTALTAEPAVVADSEQH